MYALSGSLACPLNWLNQSAYLSWFSSWVRSVLTALAGGIVRVGGMFAMRLRKMVGCCGQKSGLV